MPLTEEIIASADNGNGLRDEAEFIIDLINPGARVLDLGCGTGDLLRELKDRKKCFPQGVEISEDCIQVCVSRGLPVYHGDLDEGLADYPDQTLDYVIMTNVIQVLHRPDMLLREAARVGRKVIVSFPNFAHWKCRLQLGLYGQMPRTDNLPYDWYNSPNIHLTTIRDFRRLVYTEGLHILKEIFMEHRKDGTCRRVKLNPNFFADQAVFLISRNKD